MRVAWIMAVIVAAVSAPALAAQPELTPAAALAGLAGEWRGALGYRDYSTDRLFELPVITKRALLEDGRTLLSVSRYDEGGAPDVLITTAAAFDAKTGLYETAGFRDGRAMSITREAVAFAAPPRDATHWSLIFTEKGQDGDGPADIRVTVTRDGDAYLAVKEVDDLRTPEVKFLFRNQTRLTRVPGT